jgi:NADP-dependent 3-hydroxy acid dehydrogenase YdfG
MLKNKIVIITGASSGLGKALALQVAGLGARVALVARSLAKLTALKTEIIAAGGEAELFVCDIRDLSAVEKTVAVILKKFGSIDILVNNAGVWTDNELEKTQPELRQIALDTNVLGNIQFTQAVLPHLRAKNSGQICNVISTAGASQTPAGDNRFWQTYGATKWAMTGFTTALRESLIDTHIKVMSFFPGGFESELYATAGRPDAHDQPWMMATKDVAEIIVFALTRPPDVVMEQIVVTKMMEKRTAHQ